MNELKSKGDLCVWGDSRNSVVGIATGDEFSNVYFRSREELDAHIASLRAAAIEAWGRKVVQGRSDGAYRLEGDILVDEEGNRVSLSRPDGVDPSFGTSPADVEHGGNWSISPAPTGNVAFDIVKPTDASTPYEHVPYRWPYYLADDGQIIPEKGTVVDWILRGSADVRCDCDWCCTGQGPVISQRRRGNGRIIGAYGPGSVDCVPDGK